jgi:hypothetical protein
VLNKYNVAGMIMENSKGNTKVIVVEGILVPSQWNSRNKVTSFVISSTGENEYFIDQSNQPGKELSNYLSYKVRLKGNLKSYQTDKKVLEVTNYEIMDW